MIVTVPSLPPSNSATPNIRSILWILVSYCYLENLVVFSEGEKLDSFVAELIKVESKIGDLDHAIPTLLPISQPDNDLSQMILTSFSSGW